MKLTLHRGAGGHRIRAYEPGLVRIGEERYTRSLIVTPERLIADWPPQCLAELRPEHLAQVAALEAEVVLLGTGAHLSFPEPAILAPLMGQGLGVEVMDTRAACHTYDILVSEDRRVVAALIIA